LLRRGGLALQLDEGVARWWTFAGGRINHTLKYGFEWLRGWKVVADNFQLRLEGDGITHGTVAETIQEMTSEGFWRADETRHALRARLPEYQLSKFQDALPEAMALEMIGAWLLDFEGTLSFLRSVRE
jgi:ATP-dependent Lhr-like helicase